MDVFGRVALFAFVLISFASWLVLSQAVIQQDQAIAEMKQAIRELRAARQ